MNKYKEEEMNYELSCNKHFSAYKNLGTTLRNVTLEVEEHCGGNTQVTVLDSNNVIVRSTIIYSPGGVVTLSVNPTEGIQVLCDGGNDVHGCKLSVSVA
jgi:hypothetical protein